MASLRLFIKRQQIKDLRLSCHASLPERHKSTPPKFSSLIKTCVAFANGAGGQIIIGVDDVTHSIIGVTDEIRNRIYDDFPNSIYDNISPTLMVQIFEKRMNNQSILIIDVPIASRKPCFLKTEGIPKGVYVRVGSSTRRATEDAIAELILENKHISYDEESIENELSILSKTLITEHYGSFNKRRLLSDKMILRSITQPEKYKPTIAGTLLFCEEPDRHIPEALIRCTRFKGISGRDIIQTEAITGDIAKQIEVSTELLVSWLTRNYKLVKTRLKGKSLVPEVAIREAISNAVLHRKYSIPGAVKIAVYDDRLEVFSPGCLPGLVDINHLGDGTTFLRNPNLTRVAHKIGILEQLGSGIKLMFQACEAASIGKPLFYENGDFVKVVFYYQKIKKPEQPEKSMLLEYIQSEREVSIPMVASYLNVSRNTATRKLNELIELGLILRVGKGPRVRYILKA